MGSSFISRGLALLVMALCMLPLHADADEPSLKGSKAETAESCVEPTDVMRRRHMLFILHQRDETVHHGIRGTKYSLAGCVDCHTARDANQDFIPINAEGQFCSSCHEYAAVSIDCFHCHRTLPESKGSNHE